MQFQRKTLRTEVNLAGRGLHSGVPTQLRIRPGSDGIGFWYGGERTAAKPENVTDTTRSTKLGPIGTIEHLMSAFAGLEVTDAEVELTYPELPGMDGSALPFVEALLEVGFEDIGEKEMPDLFRRVFLQEDGIKIAISKGDGFWRYEYNTGDRWPNVQSFELQSPIDYLSQVAPARTFALMEEIPYLIQNGLGQGLDEDSAVILGEVGYKNDVRFEDEPARHKLLDFIGDMYLSGVPIRFLDAVSEKSGHRANVHAASLLAKSLE